MKSHHSEINEGTEKDVNRGARIEKVKWLNWMEMLKKIDPLC